MRMFISEKWFSPASDAIKLGGVGTVEEVTLSASSLSNGDEKEELSEVRKNSG